MNSMIEQIDRRIGLDHRLLRECHETVQPWIKLLVEIENRHFPKLCMTADGEFHREDNYHPADVELRAKIQQVIREIQQSYEKKYQELK